jgi:ferredoxin
MGNSRFMLIFTPDLVNEPITYRMVKDFDLNINILRAEIDDNGGRLIINFEGSPQQIKQALKYLTDNKVQVKELVEYVRKDSERCTDCGMCVSICPVMAFQVDKVTWKVVFLNEKCIACGMCVDACPSMAMKLGQ